MANKVQNLTIWKNRISIAQRKFNKDIGKRIELWRDYYRGKQWSGKAINAYNDQIVVNMVFSNIRSILPSINFNNPKLFVSPAKKPYRTKEGMFDTIAASLVFEILLNYYYRELSIKRQVDKCLLDALLGPWGIMEIGYCLKTEKIKDDKLLEVNEIIREDSPYVIRISPQDFLCDPESTDSHLTDTQWCARKWIKSLDDIKRNPKYTNTANLKTNYTVDISFEGNSKFVDDQKGRMEGLSDWERILGWDIWDRKTGKYYTFVDTHDKFLYEGDWPIEFEGFPFEIIYFNENPDELFPISDIDIYRTEQDELNRIRSLQLEHIKKISQRKYLSRENMMDEAEKDKLTNGPSGVIADVKGNPNDVFVPVKDASISQDIYIMAKLLKDDIREESGVPAFEHGATTKYETATEPALIAQGSQVRRAERSYIVEDFVIRIIRKFGQVLQQTMDSRDIALSDKDFIEAKEVIPSKLFSIIGQDSQILLPWITAGKEDIQGEYDFILDVGSMEQVNKEARKRDAIMLYQTLRDNPFVNIVELTKKLLTAFEEKEMETIMKNPEKVLSEQQMGYQAQIQSEIMKTQPKRDTDLAKTQIKSETNLKEESMRSRTALLTALIGQQNRGNK